MDKIFVDSEKHRLFKELVEYRNSPFYKKTMKDVFILAASIGLYLNMQSRLKRRKDIAYVSVLTEDDWWVIYSIAYATTNNLDIITDSSKSLRIAEEYANAGIDILYDIITKAGGTTQIEITKTLDKELSNVLQKIRQKNKDIF